MKVKEQCTYWTVRWTKRIDAMGRRYTETSSVYIDRYSRAEEIWKSMGFTKVSEGTWKQNGKPTSTWVNSDGSTVITRQADREIEYEIHTRGESRFKPLTSKQSLESVPFGDMKRLVEEAIQYAYDAIGTSKYPFPTPSHLAEAFCKLQDEKQDGEKP